MDRSSGANNIGQVSTDLRQVPHNKWSVAGKIVVIAGALFASIAITFGVLHLYHKMDVWKFVTKTVSDFLQHPHQFPLKSWELGALSALTAAGIAGIVFIIAGSNLSWKKIKKYIEKSKEDVRKQSLQNEIVQQEVVQQREQQDEQALQQEQVVDLKEIKQQKKEVEEWHHHIQHLCQKSQDLMDTMYRLQEVLEQQGLAAKQKKIALLAEKHCSALLSLDRTICLEQKISLQNKKAISTLLKQCQQNLDKIGRMINPILHRQYTDQRKESESEERVAWHSPQGISSEQSALQEYDHLWRQVRQQWERGEKIDDVLFEQLTAHRKQITGLFSMAECAPSPEMLQWHINYSLLKKDYQKAVKEGDRVMRQKLGFLLLQYLAKIAPPDKQLREGEKGNRGLYFASMYRYHRSDMDGILYSYAKTALFQKMTPGLFDNLGIRHRLILLDHQKVDDLLQLKYHLINGEDINLVVPNSLEEEALILKWAASIEKAVADTIEFTPPIFSFKKKLVFDFTESLKRDIQCSENDKEQKTALLKAKIDRIEQLLERAILNAAIALLQNAHKYWQPYQENFDAGQIANFIKVNSVAISQGTIDNISYMAQLPLLQHSPKVPLLLDPLKVPFEEWLGENFIQHAGLKIGALRLSYHVFDIDEDQDVLKNFPILYEIEYAPQGREEVYYPDIKELLQLRLLEQLRKIAVVNQETAPQIAIPAEAIRMLFIGMIQEISLQLEGEEEGGPIHKLYYGSVVQSTLYRYVQHLAAANQCAYDTTEFTHAIELAHAEIMTLLTLFQPYNTHDFSQIFTVKVKHIPQGLRENVKVGIGTSAMSVFTCLHACVAESLPHSVPKKVFSQGIYYEAENLLGGDRLSQVLEDENITQVDLYVAQINHGIIPDLAHRHYAPSQVIAEIEGILAKKPNTQRLTIAIDCTIDYIESPQVHNLLMYFSEQIKEGRLNFVLFGSGQKYAMLGQDNYYGAPFYIVNNGDDHWAPFKRLIDEERFQTDPISQQWFCLSTKYALSSLEDYRDALFKNTRKALYQLKSYAPQEKKTIIVSTVDDEMLASFLDIKFSDENVPEDKKGRLQGVGDRLCIELEQIFKRDGQILATRSSFGFTHTNINVVYDNVVRITLGLDPKDIDRIVEALSNIERSII